MNKTEQKNLLGDVVGNIDEIKALIKKGKYTAKIVSIDETDSNTFYNNNKYDNQKGIVINTDNNASFFIAVYPETPYRGKLGKFISKYGDIPKVNTEIEIDITGDFEEILF